MKTLPSCRLRHKALLTGALLALVAPATGIGVAQAAEDPSGAASPPAAVSPQDAQAQAALVAAEDRRLSQVRTVTTLARWQNHEFKAPYRLSTGSAYTLVLTARSTAYTVTDLLTLAPQTFRRMTDGSYLLSEHIVVLAGATLALSDPGGLTLRMASTAGGFVTIVSFGGRLELAGTAAHRLTVTSWDAAAGTPDTTTTDGRAYLRAQGGQFDMSYTDVRELGFWSGRTGGIALTGTDRPNTGAVSRSVQADKHAGSVPTLKDELGSNPVLPTGPVTAAGGTDAGSSLKYTVPVVQYVSSKIDNSTIEGNAFGLFASGVAGLQISDTTVSDSRLDGILLHRWVTSGVIERTVSRHNGGNGFVLDRATQGIVLSEDAAAANAGNGFVLSGRPLSTGPSVTGSSTLSYGNNTVSNSTASGNSGDGIRVLGGVDISVVGNHVRDNDMGIVVTQNADKVSVTGNEVSRSHRHGIALTDGVTASTVTGNIVNAASTGIYLRAVTGDAVRSNTVSNAASHGISVVGAVRDIDVSLNSLSGHGPSALDTTRSQGHVTNADNHSNGWHDTTPWYRQAKRLLQPMTLLWGTVLILLGVGAVRGRRRDSRGAPYAFTPARPRTPVHDTIVLTGGSV